MLRVIELFGGIGAFSSALDRLKKDYEIVDYVDNDMAAVQSYNAIHNTNFLPQDITKWNKDLKNIDIIMSGSPCQSVSVIGKNKGADKGSGTRSSLLWENIRIAKSIRPKVLIWENVKGILKIIKPEIPLALDGGMNGVRSNYYKLLEKQKSSQISITISPDFCL